MNRKAVRNIALILAGLLACMLIGFWLLIISVPAKGISGRIRNTDGDIFIVKDGKIRVGAFHYKGRLCYAHQSKSACYPTGSLTTRAFRYIGKRCYYFGANGYAIKRSTRYIRLRSNGTVGGWYIPGSNFKWKYNTALCRYQEKVNGEWQDRGMQCYPAEIDLQW